MNVEYTSELFMKSIYQEKKWKNVVKIDEAWIYLCDCNKGRSISLSQKRRKKYGTWFKESKESFLEDVRLLPVFPYKGKIKVKKMTKI